MNGFSYLSVCSGIEAATVAWHPLGWRPWAFSDIDKFPSAVLAHRYPHVPNLGNMLNFKEWPDAAFNLLVGGTPCQSFSVAGLRQGLADPRGNLALTFLGIADRYRPEWLVWENVPGVLSSDQGRAFGSILGGMAQLGYGFSYRILDAQYVRVDGLGRAVPQRRRRVFVVANLRDWRRAAAVLFEPESLSWNPAPSRETGQGIAPTISSRPTGGGGLGTDFDLDGGQTAIYGGVSKSLSAALGQACANADDLETYLPVAHTLTSHQTKHHSDHETYAQRVGRADVTHSLRAAGFDASEDGTGRGTPLIPINFQTRGSNIDFEQGISAIIGSNADRASGSAPCIAFSSKDYGGVAAIESSPTLRAMNFDGSHANAGGQVAIAFGIGSDALDRTGEGANGTLGDWSGLNIVENVQPSLRARNSVATAWAVRRLTPVECERLQGMEDNYTNIPWRGKATSPDGPRYKALGNSMAVNCMRWLGRRIAMVDALP